MTAHLSITGNATRDPELRYTPSGAAVASVTVAVTPRVKTDGVWGDGPAAFYRVSAWQGMAENVTESVRKGDRVTVVGELQPREYVDGQGATRVSLDVRADSIALDLRFRAAHAAPAADRTPTGPAADPWGTPAPAPTRPTAPPADPWQTPAPAPARAPAGVPAPAPAQAWPPAPPAHDEPPF